MRYSQIRKMDISNGEGIGITLFVQGCHFHCYNCFNQDTWDFNGGKEWTDETECNFLELADKPHIKRISILGGEPLAKENLGGVLNLVNKIKDRFPDKKIWLYTGYTFEEIRYYEKMVRILNYIDILVDGRFDDKLKDYHLRWRGSSNQRVIDVQKTLRTHELTLYCN